MAEKSGDFGLIGQSMEASKIYMGSNAVKKYNGILENSSMRTLSTFVKSSEVLGMGIDQDTKADDRLAKYTATKMIPTKNLGEFDDTQNVYVITDASGHDIGILTMVNGNMEFRLSPKIAEANKKILEGFPEHQREEIAKKYGLNPENLSSKDIDFKDVVEKLSKGENIAIISKEQVKVECKEEIEKANEKKIKEEYGAEYQIGSIDNDNQEKLEEELQYQKKVMDKVPEDMRAELMKKCQEKGLKVKDVLVVVCPETLEKSIDNRRTQITRDGGPVVLVQTAYSGADSLGDDIYSFQEGNELQHNEENDNSLSSIMEKHREEGTIINIDNNAQRIEQEILAEIEEAQRKIDELQKKIDAAQDQINYLETQEFENEEEREQALGKYELEIYDAEQEIEGMGKELSHTIDVIRDNAGRDFGGKTDNIQEDYEDSHIEPTIYNTHGNNNYNNA